MKVPVSATIITLNEEHNLPRALRSVLPWCDEVLVVDSGSTDRTRQIASEFGARIIDHPWKGYGQQKNFAQDQARNDWVLNLDADEVVPPELAEEIQRILPQTNCAGFQIPRKTFFWDRWIRHGGWYPNALVRLAHRKKARWSEPNVHESWIVEGKVGRLENPFHHFTFRTIEDQVRTNLRYSRYGSEDLARYGRRASLWKLIFKPIGKFFETYFFKMGFLDGLPGFLISVNAAHSMFLKYAYLVEEKPPHESAHRRQPSHGR